MSNSNHETSEAEKIESEKKKQHDPWQVGSGVLLILFGAGMLAERMGWFAVSKIGFLPLIFVVWGVVMIYEEVRRK